MQIKKTVLIVDDTPANISLLGNLLKENYKAKVATNGRKALQMAFAADAPDLILLDVIMPDMDGYEVCRRLKADEKTREIPVIFLTAKSEEADEMLGLTLGAVDYVTKPINPLILMARLQTHMSLKDARDQLKNQNEILEEKVRQRTRQTSRLQDVAMVAMGSLAETRDPETGSHIQRTQLFVRIISEELKHHPQYADYLTPEKITMLYKSAPLHDIGKVGIPDTILLKPGKLTIAEREEMQKHTTCGRNAIVAAEKILGESDNFLQIAEEVAYSHHEKWDGSGYPIGLSAHDIPICARLMAIADVYDALISPRVYKPPFSQKKTVAIINEGRSTHFDPIMVDSFLRVADQCYAVANKFADMQNKS